ncbi:MAG: PCRF domain-containing protein, partial [Minisyncoccales bacterium]
MISFKEIKEEYNKILKKLSNPEIFSNNQEKAKKLGKRKSYLEPIVERIKKIEKAQKEKKENKEIINGNDKELKELAKKSNKKIEQRIQRLKNEIKEIVKNENNFPGRPILIEIRAGTGGKEAALFAAELYKMYSKYAKKKNWSLKILNSNKTDLEGLKEISFEIRGKNVYPNIKYEAGVHRVQRIPETEKSGRIHTSTVSVAILPKPKKAEIKIDPSNIRIDRFRASGPGGQSVNTSNSAVRV